MLLAWVNQIEMVAEFITLVTHEKLEDTLVAEVS